MKVVNSSNRKKWVFIAKPKSKIKIKVTRHRTGVKKGKISFLGFQKEIYLPYTQRRVRKDSPSESKLIMRSINNLKSFLSPILGTFIKDSFIYSLYHALSYGMARFRSRLIYLTARAVLLTKELIKRSPNGRAIDPSIGTGDLNDILAGIYNRTGYMRGPIGPQPPYGGS